MTSSKDYKKDVCVQSPAEKGVQMRGLQLGFQLQPLGTSSSQGIRQRQEISSLGTDLTETELGSTFAVGNNLLQPLTGKQGKKLTGNMLVPFV